MFKCTLKFIYNELGYKEIIEYNEISDIANNFSCPYLHLPYAMLYTYKSTHFECPTEGINFDLLSIVGSIVVRPLDSVNTYHIVSGLCKIKRHTCTLYM